MVRLLNVFANATMEQPEFLQKVFDLLVAARGWLLLAIGLIAAIFFILNIIKFMASDDEGLRAQYRRRMIGIGIALVAAYSIIGVISWIGDYFTP